MTAREALWTRPQSEILLQEASSSQGSGLFNIRPKSHTWRSIEELRMWTELRTSRSKGQVTVEGLAFDGTSCRLAVQQQSISLCHKLEIDFNQQRKSAVWPQPS
jgi:hypothetical protein